jgi:hypothetical protein
MSKFNMIQYVLLLIAEAIVAPTGISVLLSVSAEPARFTIGLRRARCDCIKVIQTQNIASVVSDTPQKPLFRTRSGTKKERVRAAAPQLHQTTPASPRLPKLHLVPHATH